MIHHNSTLTTHIIARYVGIEASSAGALAMGVGNTLDAARDPAYSITLNICLMHEVTK